MQQKIAFLLILALPSVASATDYTGLGTMLIGYPTVLAALASNLLVKTSESPGKTLRSINAFLSLIFLLSTAFVVRDLIGMFQGNDAAGALVYLGLAACTVAIAVRNFGDGSDTTGQDSR